MKPWERYGYPPPKSEASKGKYSLVDYEIYSGIEIPLEPCFVRLDGWKFHRLCRQLRVKKPYDKFLATCLVETSKRFFTFLSPVLAYIFSDEINLLFLTTDWRRVEKIDSVFAALATSAFSHELEEKYDNVPELAFDCRCVPLPREKIKDYLVWRQAEAFRNHNNAWAYWLLRSKEKLSARSATKKLNGLKARDLRGLANKYGKNLNRTPVWQRRGILVYKEVYMKKGWNPIEKREVMVERRKAIVDWEPPLFRSSEGKRLLEKLLKD